MVRPEHIYECGTLRLDTRARVLLRENIPVTLAPKSFELLRILIENQGRAMSKRELLDALWPDVEVEEGNLPFQVSILRKALGVEAGAWIETVPRHGYRWSAPIATHSATPHITGEAEDQVHPFAGRSLLPAPRTTLIGRDKELASLKRLLLSPESRLVTVTGAGGVGKTRLALQVAAELTDHFRYGVYYVPLASIAHHEMVASSIAQAIQFRHTGGKSLVEGLQEYVRLSVNAPALILIDNFEHVAAAAPVVAGILEACAFVKVLVTSRTALRLYGEYEHLVTGLAVPDSEDLPPFEELSQNAAVSLFVQRASAVSQAFELTRDNAGTVAQVCSRLDGFPLAIELAAARTKVFSPAEILSRLTNRLGLLTGIARDVPVRQQSLRNTIEWSYCLLNPAEQKLFRRLSVFAGGCTPESAEAVCDTRRDLGIDLLEGLSSLLNNSLLQPSDSLDGPRFVMLETIREYALERLEEHGEVELALRAHAAYCLVLAEEGNLPTSASQQAEWLRQCANEHGNLRAAIDWLIESGNADWAMRMGVALFPYWDRKEHFPEGFERLKKILKMSRAKGHTRERAMVATCAGALAAALGDSDECQRFFGKSLRIYRELEDNNGIATQLNLMGANLGIQGKYPEARSLLEQSVIAWRSLGELAVLAGVLCNLADVVNLEGNSSHANSLLTEALSIFRELDDESGAAWTFNYLGDVAHTRGETEAARHLYSKSANAFRHIGDRAGLARSQADLAYVACEAGDYVGAASMFEEALGIFRDLGNKRGLARVFAGLAYLAARQHDFERAMLLAGATTSLRRSVGARVRPSEQASLEMTLRMATGHQESPSADAAWRAGCHMALKEVIAYAVTHAQAPRV